MPTLQKLAEVFEVPISKLVEEEQKEKSIYNIQNITITNGTGAVNGDTSNNFCEKKEAIETLKNAIVNAVADAVAKELAKYIKIT